MLMDENVDMQDNHLPGKTGMPHAEGNPTPVEMKTHSAQNASDCHGGRAQGCQGEGGRTSHWPPSAPQSPVPWQPLDRELPECGQCGCIDPSSLPPVRWTVAAQDGAWPWTCLAPPSAPKEVSSQPHGEMKHCR